ncbi:ABC transporter substrate-binding protein [Paenarthrobacter histidinolovorans]|uniref:NitT/TauT family transport system substrate-binding protein n=1 Tax=Paenarthrobacter histidinolovorans TaxID=43664 RepID=A0ABW8N6V5_9MICC
MPEQHSTVPGGTIRIAAARNLAYLPHYVGISRGYFAAEGLTVDVLEQPPGHGTITDAVIRGEADLVLGSVVFADRLNRTKPSAVVAVSNTQTRHFLFQKADDIAVGGSPENFDWNALRGRVIIVAPTYVPTSWVAFLDILHQRSIPLGDIRILVGYQPEAVVEEFLAGPGDFLLAGGQEAQDPRLREAVPLANGLGPVPWSVYCATRSWAQEHQPELNTFRSALGKAQAWLAEQSPTDVATAAQEWFPAITPRELHDTVAQFQRIGFWAKTPQAVPAEFRAWQAALIRAGLLADDANLLAMIEDPAGKDQQGDNDDTNSA